MKIRRIRTLMISAYLTAMLASSLAPVRGDVALAGAIDSAAARQALQSAIAELNVGGWAPPVTAPANVTVPPAASVPAPVIPPADPVISQELMARLIKRTLASKKEAVIIAQLCAAFDLCDGTGDIPAKQVSTTEPDGKHFFSMPIREGSQDIIIALKRTDVTFVYLTDKSGKLRAAMILDPVAGDRMIPNEQAAEKFKAELRLFAKLAQDLPPTGTEVAGNS